MQQPISNYHQDENRDWVAELACGHFQHVRHNPPWSNREWVTTEAGRKAKIGVPLNCVNCDRGEAQDTKA